MEGDVRRVVLGRDGSGASTVTDDGLASAAHRGWSPGYAVTEIWATTAQPPPIDGDDPTGTGLDTNLPRGHTKFWVAEFPPGNGGIDPVMHSTPTLDYLAILQGSISLDMEDGTSVTLHAGDTAVQRGTVHAWRNDGTEPCRIAVVMLGLV